MVLVRQLAGRLLAVATVASAFVAVNSSSALGSCPYPALEWDRNTLTVRIGTSIGDGWHDEVLKASNQWSGVQGANWTVDYQYRYSAAVSLQKQDSAPPGFAGSPAVTDLRFPSGSITSGDMYFNDRWTWNKNGNFNQGNRLADVRTVAIHELGHEVYLNHPNACGPPVSDAERAAVMNPNFTQKWVLKPDDKDGLAFRK